LSQVDGFASEKKSCLRGRKGGDDSRSISNKKKRGEGRENFTVLLVEGESTISAQSTEREKGGELIFFVGGKKKKGCFPEKAWRVAAWKLEKKEEGKMSYPSFYWL